ncbi:hypothetical protein BDN70DRAFT_932265 [Pholiota conissans]|uniref:DUF6534 domain-containing protein n=1 Tax=Pholiota conissans TaxID=109636 RepID=A0A9P5Z400_9AGAR|nr:hypothetical protein BDN70DRAFT_932265 [Pholiota conissans]
MAALGTGPSSALDSTYGAYLIGVLFATFLQGLLTIQAWNYYEKFPNDPLKHKILVLTVWILDTAHLVVVCQSVYHYLVTDWGFEPALNVATWELVIHIFLIGLSCFLCQLFFLHRIWIFSRKNYFVVGLVMVLCLATLALSIHLPIHVMLSHIPISEFPSDKPEILALFLVGAGSDFLIAGLLCFYLRLNKPGFQPMRSVLGRVLQYAVATGLVTSALRIGAVIALLAAPTKLYYIAMHLSLGRLYTNALLATLNARAKMREVLKGHQPSDPLRLPRSRTNIHFATDPDSFHSIDTNTKTTGENNSLAFSYTVERVTHRDEDMEMESAEGRSHKSASLTEGTR